MRSETENQTIINISLVGLQFLISSKQSQKTSNYYIFIIYFLHRFLLHVPILQIIFRETSINITNSGSNQNVYNKGKGNDTLYLVKSE